jgi:hypothetical protein
VYDYSESVKLGYQHLQTTSVYDYSESVKLGYEHLQTISVYDYSESVNLGCLLRLAEQCVIALNMRGLEVGL